MAEPGADACPAVSRFRLMAGEGWPSTIRFVVPWQNRMWMAGERLRWHYDGFIGCLP
jgi:hypothetical protein